MEMLKVVWQEGMLLRPQHFQQNDRYFEHQLKSRSRLQDIYPWGFFSLEIDRQFLNMGKLVLSQASGILPDGTLFELGSEREPLALDIPPNTGSTPVYLALPLVTGNHIETRRPEQKDVLARYTAHELDVADSNAGDSSTSQVRPWRIIGDAPSAALDESCVGSSSFGKRPRLWPAWRRQNSIRCRQKKRISRSRQLPLMQVNA